MINRRNTCLALQSFLFSIICHFIVITFSALIFPDSISMFFFFFRFFAVQLRTNCGHSCSLYAHYFFNFLFMSNCARVIFWFMWACLCLCVCLSLSVSVCVLRTCTCVYKRNMLFVHLCLWQT